MLKQVKLGLFALSFAGLMVSCNNEGGVREDAANAAAGEASETVTPATEIPADAATAADAAPTGPTTTVSFAETEFDFGTVDAGDIVSHEFSFTNTGSEPLIISNAKGSCGCTVPKWPKDPIAPGATGKILVEFNSKGKKNKQNKKVTITANTEPAQSFLYIKGDVTPEPGSETPATNVQVQ
ncbi:MAG: DUF1573 domain-containing protein [Phaeodactylibacter sp.]|nr:DUF1573 domain-containing protein [Phaeodactylibacter sp.]